MAGSKNVDLSFLQSMIDKTEPGVKLISYETKLGSKRGDNYTSMLYRIKVYGDHGWMKSLIYKCLPENKQTRSTYKSEMLFNNEVTFYVKSYTALMEYQELKRLTENFNSVPKCYLAQSDIVVLEDMRCKGFAMLDRKKGLDFDHCKAILRGLGKFHGLSLSMKVDEPEKFKRCISEAIKEVYYRSENELWYKGYYRRAAENADKMLESELTEDEKPKYLERFRLHIDPESLFSYMVGRVSPKEPLAVLCHGDCWTNNFLFQYGTDGSISEISIVDFQMARYGSPALDLVSLLYCCTSVELRRRCLPELMEEYYDSISSFLAQTNCLHHYPDLRQKLDGEMREYNVFGLGVALDMIPIITCDSDQAPDMYTAEDTINADDDEPSKEPYPTMTTSVLCRTMITDLVKELVDNGCLT